MKKLLYLALAGIFALPFDSKAEEAPKFFCSVNYEDINEKNRNRICDKEIEKEAKERKPRVTDVFEVVDCLFVEGPFREYNGWFANQIYGFNEAMREIYEKLKYLEHVRIDIPKGLDFPEIRFGRETKPERTSVNDGGSEIEYHEKSKKIRIKLEVEAKEDGVFCGWEKRF